MYMPSNTRRKSSFQRKHHRKTQVNRTRINFKRGGTPKNKVKSKIINVSTPLITKSIPDWRKDYSGTPTDKAKSKIINVSTPLITKPMSDWRKDFRYKESIHQYLSVPPRSW